MTAGQENSTPTRYAASGDVHVVGGREFDLRADNIDVDQSSGLVTADGHLRLHEIDTTFLGGSLTYDERAQRGEIVGSLLEYPPFYISSPRLIVRPGSVLALNATLSTCPPDARTEFHVQTDQLSFDAARQRVYLRGAKVYLYGTRLFEFRRYSIRTSANPNQNAINQPLRPSLGYDNQRGPYLVIGRNLGSEAFPVRAEVLVPSKRDPSASLTTSTTILLNKNADRPATQDAGQPVVGANDLAARVRSFASFPGRPLPAGDPLLFHDFLGNNPLESVLNAPVTPALQPGVTLSYREPLYGRRVGNLNLSKLPEGALRLDLPLYGQGALPTDRDPADMRRALRSLYVYASANASTGYYQERPTSVKSDRTAGNFSLSIRPLLVGDNLLFRPSMRFYQAEYATSRTQYGYEQFSLALQRSYGPYTAIGAQYTYTAQHGRDPFVFDSVDTSQEFDLRGQTGIGHDIVGARLKYDLRRDSLYDYEIDYSFPQHCFIPTIIYDHVSHLIGLGFNIEGVTF